MLYKIYITKPLKSHNSFYFSRIYIKTIDNQFINAYIQIRTNRSYK